MHKEIQKVRNMDNLISKLWISKLRFQIINKRLMFFNRIVEWYFNWLMVMLSRVPKSVSKIKIFLINHNKTKRR
jgi:hypothetical protein